MGEAEPLVRRLQSKRSEMMIAEVEAVALRLFEERGFADVTVREIADAARVSVRTFYRYFPVKEDVLQVRIQLRGKLLREALSGRPPDEPPLHGLRLAIAEVAAKLDPVLTRRWISVMRATPGVMRSVVGAVHLITNQVIAEFFGERLGQPPTALVPRVLAAAAVGVLEEANVHWYLTGGDLVAGISESLEVLERGIGGQPEIWASWG